MVCLGDDTVGEPLIKMGLEIGEVARAEYESRAYHRSSAGARRHAGRPGHRGSACRQCVDELPADIGGPANNGVDRRPVPNVGRDEHLSVAQYLASVQAENELFAVVPFDAGDAKAWATQLIRCVAKDPGIREIGSQINKDLSQPTGYERFPAELMDPVEIELTAGLEIGLQLTAGGRESREFRSRAVKAPRGEEIQRRFSGFTR